MTRPKVQKRPHQPPKTTSHASRPPSGYSVSMTGGIVCVSGRASIFGAFSDDSNASCRVELVVGLLARAMMDEYSVRRSALGVVLL